MIRLDSKTQYEESLRALARVTGHNYLGRLVQIFLACKFYGHTIPEIGSQTGIDIKSFQRLLDDLYSKPSYAPTPVVSLFSDNHLPRTGVAVGGQGAANNWRNNFNLQKGYSCFASAAELLDPTFRTASRIQCSHLAPASPGSLQGAQCSLAGSGATYRRDDHPKIFRIDPSTHDHFIFDPTDASYRQLVRLPNGNRLPVAPLICALYYDSQIATGRTAVDTSDFLHDFSFSTAEYQAYFDDDPALPVHQQLCAAFADFVWTPVAAGAAVAPSPPTPLPLSAPAAPVVGPTAPPAIDSLPDPTNTGTPPAGSRWWDAEQAVRTVLEADGWLVTDRSRQAAGFDFDIRRGNARLFVEVKSSGGRCTPTLTENEFRQAVQLGDKYVLAIVENFDPNGEAEIYWVGNPAALSLTPRTTIVYPVSRSQWRKRTRKAVND